MEKDDGVIQIHGRSYHTVARRVADFRDKHPDFSITTKVLSAGELIRVKATIRDSSGRVISTGLAEELRGATNINKTSALENAETSAVGRALAFFGLGGSNIASADEIQSALEQQKELETLERLKAHNASVRDNIESVTAIKAYLLNDEYSAAYEAWSEISNEEKAALWVSTTQGGIFTTKERAQMKSDEWNAAKNEFHGDLA